MDIKETSNKQHPYDNWKAITESDFVTLFIKTWFAFVATLRELYPEHKPYYKASGDSPFISAYKNDFGDKIHFLCKYDEIKQNLLNTYEKGFKITSEKYPRFLIDDFYGLNPNFSYKKTDNFTSSGGYSGELSLLIKCVKNKEVQIELHCFDEKFLEKAGENIPLIVNQKINYNDILQELVKELEEAAELIDESEIIASFYKKFVKIIGDKLTEVLGQKQQALPDKGFTLVKQVFGKILAFCNLAINDMHNLCVEPSVSTELKLLYQTPIPDFIKNYDKMSSSDNKNAYLWFIEFVYRLRNALFHEIIDPLNNEWQFVFKNAYLVLKQIVDANINSLKYTDTLSGIAPFLFEEYFKNFYSQQIPIKEYDGTTFSTKTQLKYFNPTGAKVHIVSIINHKGNKTYHVECDVIWDSSFKNHEVENVQIKNQEQLTETIITGNHHEQN